MIHPLNTPQDFRDFIKRALKEQGLTHRQLADRINVSEHAVRYYFRTDSPNHSARHATLHQVADALGYDIIAVKRGAGAQPNVPSQSSIPQQSHPQD